MLRFQKLIGFLIGMGCDKNLSNNTVKKNISDNIDIII